MNNLEEIFEEMVEKLHDESRDFVIRREDEDMVVNETIAKINNFIQQEREKIVREFAEALNIGSGTTKKFLEEYDSSIRSAKSDETPEDIIFCPKCNAEIEFIPPRTPSSISSIKKIELDPDQRITNLMQEMVFKSGDIFMKWWETEGAKGFEDFLSTLKGSKKGKGK